jgi:hypothetical protein
MFEHVAAPIVLSQNLSECRQAIQGPPHGDGGGDVGEHGDAQ